MYSYVQGMTLFSSMLYMTGKITEGHVEANAACHAGESVAFQPWFYLVRSLSYTMWVAQDIFANLESSGSAAS